MSTIEDENVIKNEIAMKESELLNLKKQLDEIIKKKNENNMDNMMQELGLTPVKYYYLNQNSSDNLLNK
tara:strand:- start:5230 stop:5436 length:207 start_codon:yes stop_codon:yes gene_type:complete